MKRSNRYRKEKLPLTVRLLNSPEINALHKNPDPSEIPCYRVVNAKGELSDAFAFGGADEQANRLRADGIEVLNGKVDLKKYAVHVVDGQLE